MKEMKKDNFINNKWPEKIVYEGDNYHKTKNFSMPNLALMIEIDLFRLINSYNELTCNFKIHLTPCKDSCNGFLIELISKNCDALIILRDEVEQILGSYNKQLLIKREGRIHSHYCRFYYNIEFQHKRFFAVKGVLK